MTARQLRKFTPDLKACADAVRTILNGGAKDAVQEIAFIIVAIPFNPAITDCSEAPMMVSNMPLENTMVVLKDIVTNNE